jgi:MFS family permease
VLTGLLSWHWVFLVNVPVGAAVVVLSLKLIPEMHGRSRGAQLDVAGAVAVTGSLVLATYAIVNGSRAGWTSLETLGLLGLAAGGIAGFVWWESRVASPLMPLRLFKIRNLTVANGSNLLWSGGMMSSFFVMALYLQLVLKYSPLQVGLAFLPSNILMGVLSIGFAARFIVRFGFRVPLVVSCVSCALGLALFVMAPAHGSFLLNVLPGTLLIGVGPGIGMAAVFLAAMSDVPPQDMGLASGLANTTPIIGGALGIAVTASVSATRTGSLVSHGVPHLLALNSGYHYAFAVGSLLILAVLPVLYLLRPMAERATVQPALGEPEPVVGP